MRCRGTFLHHRNGSNEFGPKVHFKSEAVLLQTSNSRFEDRSNKGGKGMPGFCSVVLNRCAFHSTRAWPVSLAVWEFCDDFSFTPLQFIKFKYLGFWS